MMKYVLIIMLYTTFGTTQTYTIGEYATLDECLATMNAMPQLTRFATPAEMASRQYACGPNLEWPPDETEN